MAKKKQDKKQEKGRRAGWIAFGATALLYAAIFPLYRIGDFILAAALSFLVGKVVSIMGSGLDLTTHNKEDAAKKAQEVEAYPTIFCPTEMTRRAWTSMVKARRRGC